MRRAAVCILAGTVLAGGVLVSRPAPVRADLSTLLGSFSWPVVGPVIRGYEPPPTPYSAGHRGIDIAVPFGTAIRAPADGTVTFAGWVAGSMFVTIDHGDGVRSSYSWLSQIMTSKGTVLARRAVFARTGHGHPDVPTPHLHFGVRVNGEYVDPMLFLGSGSLVNIIHLAELTGREAVVLAGPFRSPMMSRPEPSVPHALPVPPRPRGVVQRRGGGLVTLPRGPPRARYRSMVGARRGPPTGIGRPPWFELGGVAGVATGPTMAARLDRGCVHCSPDLLRTTFADRGRPRWLRS